MAPPSSAQRVTITWAMALATSTRCDRLMSSRKRKMLVRSGSVKSHSDIPSEDHEQMMFVQWFRRNYPGVLIFATPNGGARHPAVAMKLKATGVVKGIPDLFVPAWSLWIEMKRQDGGRVSPEQKEVMAYLEGIGHRAIVAKGAEDAKHQVIAIPDPTTRT